MDYITIIGLIAGACTTISFLPQVFKIYRTREARGLSLGMYIILSVGISLWVVYGILSKNLPIIMANSIVFILCIWIVIMKIKYG